MFCDWLNVWQQHEGDWPDFLGGRVVSIEGACGLLRAPVLDRETGELAESWTLAGGEIDYDVAKFEQHRGSFETTIMVRMVNGRLEVRGNPSSWGRLDNVFGVTLDEGVAIYNEILRGLGLPEFTEGETSIRVGAGAYNKVSGQWQEDYTGAHVTRVDMTQNCAVGMGNVKAFHKWLTQQKVYRSAPDDDQIEQFMRWDYSTVYLSESKFWVTAKFYDKARALTDVTLVQYLKKLKASAKEGRINTGDVWTLYKEAEDYLNGLACWCAEQGIARGEWSFRNRWFAQHQGLGFWKPGETEGAILDAAGQELDKIMKRAVVYQQDSYDALTDKEFRVLSDWKRGDDLLGLGKLSKSAFYRFRTSIREKTGMDIASRPIHRVSESRPVFFQVKPVTMRDAPLWYQRPSVPSLLTA